MTSSSSTPGIDADEPPPRVAASLAYPSSRVPVMRAIYSAIKAVDECNRSASDLDKNIKLLGYVSMTENEEKCCYNLLNIRQSQCLSTLVKLHFQFSYTLLSSNPNTTPIITHRFPSLSHRYTYARTHTYQHESQTNCQTHLSSHLSNPSRRARWPPSSSQ